MKRLLGLLLCLSLLTACGAPPSSMETEYTGEELFLQEAYWYLQSDEKEIFSWENGVLENYCAEEPRMVIGPEGEVDIQGMDLQRVRYERWRLFNGTIYGTTNLYFQEDGTFVGTDGSQFWEDQPEEQQNLYDGDISMWVFLSSPEVGVDDTLTVTCVLKKTEGPIDTYSAYGDVMELAIYQNGQQRNSGLDASGRILDFSQEPVQVVTRSIDKGYWSGGQGLSDEELFGDYTIRVAVDMTELPNGVFEERHTRLSLTKFLKFTVA